MIRKEKRPYGLWPSPITPVSLAAALRLDEVQYDADGRTLVWLEGRSGHGVLVARAGDDASNDLTSDVNVRAEVSYGGGDFTVHGGVVYFIEKQSGRIYRQSIDGGPAKAITPQFGSAAAPAVSPDGRHLVYVHHDGRQTDRLAVVDTAGEFWPQILTAGHDFYMQPRFSPDGRRVCWIAWDHPNMPWDGTSLYVADVQETGGGLPRLTAPRMIAGGPETAIFQPEFTATGQLVYVSDKTGWGQIYVHDLEADERRRLTNDGFEYATPAWIQGIRTYAVIGDGQTLVAAASRDGFHQLQRIDVASGECATIDKLSIYTDVSQVSAAPSGERIAFVGSSATTPPRVIQYDCNNDTARIVARSASETVPAAALSKCEAIQWETADGETAHGLFYPPASARFESSGRPPLVVLVHGGPTSQARAAWKPDAQFLATRGYAVLLVNYRGSTGYGRDYMLRLRGNWGVWDVEDCVSGAAHLADQGRIDRQRTVIMGGSAGGFTVLETMVERPEAFTAGICLYPVANQFDLAADTHKFESRYLDSLLGPLPETAELYRRRSPVFHADKIRRPLAVFQGDIDRVVPRAQSDAIVEALKRTGTPHEYHVYEGEGHGWRNRETIEHFYKSVDRFLRRWVIFS